MPRRGGVRAAHAGAKRRQSRVGQLAQSDTTGGRNSSGPVESSGVTGTPGRQNNRGSSSGRATGDSGAAMDLRPRFLKHRMGGVFWIIGAVVQIPQAKNARS
jgi:hypothetical protein